MRTVKDEPSANLAVDELGHQVFKLLELPYFGYLRGCSQDCWVDSKIASQGGLRCARIKLSATVQVCCSGSILPISIACT
jgi:hypothetical protein